LAADIAGEVDFHEHLWLTTCASNAAASPQLFKPLVKVMKEGLFHVTFLNSVQCVNSIRIQGAFLSTITISTTGILYLSWFEDKLFLYVMGIRPFLKWLLFCGELTR
jgi:hypothetical protein